MDTATLRQRLMDILDEEERPNVDWVSVQRLCINLYDEVSSAPELDCPHIVYHFLSDADIRQKDLEYGRDQRVEIRRFAETGECDNSKPVSGRSCFFVALAFAAVMAAWMLN